MVGLLLLGLFVGAQDAQAQSETAPARSVRKLARVFRCDRDTIALAFIRREYDGNWEVTGWRVTGCGEPFMAATNRFRGITTIIHWDVPMRRRAPFDLTCDADALTYTYVDYATRVAHGCGRQMTYVLADAGQWMANVVVEQPALAQPPVMGIEGGSLPE